LAPTGGRVPILLSVAASASGIPWAELTSTFRLDLLAKLALAVVLGGAIGVEREIKAKPAGLRTNILICVGAVLLTDVSVRIGLIDGPPRVGDPGRIAAQIVSGIGFLGAGTIMQGGGTVTGLTSAATIWVVAALGMASGAGFYIEAAGAGVLVMLVLASLGRLEHKIRRVRRIVHYTVRTKRGTVFETLRDTLDAHGIIVVSHQAYDHADDRTFELRLTGPAIQFETLNDALEARADVLSVLGHGG